MINVDENIDSNKKASRKRREMKELLHEIIEKINRAFHEGRNYYTSDPILIDLVGILHARMFLYFSKELQAINKKLDKIIKQTKSIN